MTACDSRPGCLTRPSPAVPASPEAGRSSGRARHFGARGLQGAGAGEGKYDPGRHLCASRTKKTSYSARLMSARSGEGFWGRGRHQECRATSLFYPAGATTATPFGRKHFFAPAVEARKSLKVVLREGSLSDRSRDWSSISPSPGKDRTEGPVPARRQQRAARDHPSLRRGPP